MPEDPATAAEQLPVSDPSLYQHRIPQLRVRLTALLEDAAVGANQQGVATVHVQSEHSWRLLSPLALHPVQEQAPLHPSGAGAQTAVSLGSRCHQPGRAGC